MGNEFSRDGAITKMVESLPGGGWITAPVHAAAGNSAHALQAAVAGFGTAAGTVLAGPAAGLLVGIGGAGLSTIIDRYVDEDGQKQQVRDAAKRGDYDTANRILLEAAQKKIAANANEIHGLSILRSCHGTYLGANQDWHVEMTPEAKGWEKWYIDNWGGKVVLKGRAASNKQDQFLCAHPDGIVDLTEAAKEWEMWKPLKNDDGSWSLLSAHGTWLSANKDGSVSVEPRCLGWERFWLERWSQ